MDSSASKGTCHLETNRLAPKWFILRAKGFHVFNKQVILSVTWMVEDGDVVCVFSLSVTSA